MKPILFNTEMVRAILEGRKTVTRRVIKPRNPIIANREGYKQGYGLWIDPSTDNGDKQGHIKDYSISPLWSTWKWYINHYAPYQVGDILYVRETWGFDNHNWLYKADFSDEDLIKLKRLLIWHPSIHMPKEAARIFLKVTDVRVERLQEITNEGCKAEGTDLDEWYEYDEWQHQAGDGCVAEGIPVVFETLRGFFGSRIWNSTIKNKDEYYRYGWDANPWVWVIEFERIEQGEQ